MLPNGLPEVFATCSILLNLQNNVIWIFQKEYAFSFTHTSSSSVTALLVSSLLEMYLPVLVLIKCQDGCRINTKDSYCQHTYRQPIPLQRMLASTYSQPGWRSLDFTLCSSSCWRSWWQLQLNYFQHLSQLDILLISEPKNSLLLYFKILLHFFILSVAIISLSKPSC